jgi:hypothetical protein
MEHETTQLVLITEVSAEWRLDERTREVGRRGVEQARRALRAALANRTDHPTAA